MKTDRDFGKPIVLKINESNHLKRQMLKSSTPDDNMPPDHILESRVDCALTFLQEGLLPTLRDEIGTTNPQQVIEIAEHFLVQFREAHPKDFDLEDYEDLLGIALGQLFFLSVVYEVGSKQSTDSVTILNLIEKADDLLTSILDEDDESL